MRGRLMFLTGAAVGYVLGARAGRGRYEQIKSQADALWSDPRVQTTVSQAQAKVADTAGTAGSAVLDAAKEKAPDVKAAFSSAAETTKSKIADLKPGGSDTTTGTSPYAAGTSYTPAHGTASAGAYDTAAPAGDDLQIGSEPGSDYAAHQTKYNSAE